MLKKLGRNPALLKAAGLLLAAYLRLVRKTNSMVIDPPDAYDRLQPHRPFICAMWHGQHFMMPFTRPDDWDVHVMISRSADGEINATAAEKLGLKLIRASGSQKSYQITKRGGMRGFIEGLRVLKEGGIMALTADVPKGPARVAGQGIVQMARHSGCPIVPIAIATSRFLTFNSWDKASLNLPFGRAAIAIGEPIYVANDADDEALEVARLAVEAGLNEVTARAYALTGKRHG